MREEDVTGETLFYMSQILAEVEGLCADPNLTNDQKCDLNLVAKYARRIKEVIGQRQIQDLLED
ncbi:MAG: hypothetical protein Unbinned8472contig1000_25 [Prokaryotic dsDNA virus sp.]|nr:MAG: hypothetical protein Unbinned8472contig1000_25 [Prokaryotic dsDNA virus sp.]|tara:strand:- start:4934 stop:5125 length:192 start_codon:yes stop_codon:yes gene_type:complete